MIGGKTIIEPPERDARWFIYHVRLAQGELCPDGRMEIRSLKKLTGNELLQRVYRRLNGPRKKK